jgi:hypothetical protein
MADDRRDGRLVSAFDMCRRRRRRHFHSIVCIVVCVRVTDVLATGLVIGCLIACVKRCLRAFTKWPGLGVMVGTCCEAVPETCGRFRQDINTNPSDILGCHWRELPNRTEGIESHVKQRLYLQEQETHVSERLRQQEWGSHANKHQH